MSKGPYSEVEALLGCGRLEDALSALTRAGGERWERFLWRGRIEEKRGRLKEAEACFRRAAALEPRAAPELARLHEEEAFAAHRKARLGRLLRTKAGRARVEADVRAGLNAPAPVSGARLETLLFLIEGGRYAPGLERALLGAVSRAGDGDKLAAEWPQIFSELMCAGLYLPAFRLGEAVLDRFGRFETPGQLMWPWWRRIRRAVAEEDFLRRELARVRAAASSGEFPHWFAYYRAILLNNLAQNKGAMAEYAKLKGLDAGRYSWMWQSFVLVKLGVLDFPGAVVISRDILSRAPSHWWVRCRMAEALMAGGDVAGGLREFETAERTCGAAQLGEVLTWHGEVLLWLGEYARALEKLDAAVAAGAKSFVLGWRGAVHLKRGDHARALADLDAAVARDPKDFEARGWRAEAHRLAGRHGEASADLEHLVSRGPHNFWTYINRALLRDALGDEKGMAEDYAQAPPEMLERARARLGVPRAPGLPGRDEMRRVLTFLLEWAKGVRRWENYTQAIWMERTT